MTDGLFHNLVWNALHTVHSHFAVGGSTAVRYPADVVPLAALADNSHCDLSPLEEMLAPGERVYLLGPQPQPTRKTQRRSASSLFPVALSLASAIRSESQRSADPANDARRRS